MIMNYSWYNTLKFIDIHHVLLDVIGLQTLDILLPHFHCFLCKHHHLRVVNHTIHWPISLSLLYLFSRINYSKIIWLSPTLDGDDLFSISYQWGCHCLYYYISQGYVELSDKISTFIWLPTALCWNVFFIAVIALWRFWCPIVDSCRWFCM